jgi:PAS domain S-box-containing protein
MENNRVNFKPPLDELRRKVHLLDRLAPEFKIAEDTLKDHQLILRTLINTIPNPAFYKDVEGVYIDCNKAFGELILGATRETIIGRTLYDLPEAIPKDFADTCHQRDIKLLRKHGVQVYEAEVRCADGAKRDFLFRRATFFDHSGTVAGIVGVMLDLTEKNRSERLLRERTAELVNSNSELKRQINERQKAEKLIMEAHREIEHLISAIPTILIGLSRENEIIHWNSVAEEVFDIPSAAVMGLPFGLCGIRWEWDKIQEGISQCQTEGRPKRLDDIRFLRPDGGERFLGLTINPINGDDDSIFGLTIVGADITDRKRLEAQLYHSQKMEAIGQLAAGIAHEINTPTQFAGDNTRFLQDAFTDLIQITETYSELLEAAKSKSITDEIIQKVEENIRKLDLTYLTEEIPVAIQHTLKGVDRIAKIVQAMKIFAHPGGEEKEPVDINKEIEKTITITRNKWKYVADLITDFDSSMPLVPCLRGEFNQVILNLIINAVDATADLAGDDFSRKGTIRISTRHEGNWAEIRIGDAGTGIPKDIRYRVFDLFFTTKDPGKGSGQGLAISHSVIVEKHHGTITFETQEGKGTTFIIRLPIETRPGDNERENEEADPICR